MNKPETVLTDEEATELIEQADGTELSDGEFVRLVEQAVLAKLAKKAEPSNYLDHEGYLMTASRAKFLNFDLDTLTPLYTQPPTDTAGPVVVTDEMLNAFVEATGYGQWSLREGIRAAIAKYKEQS